MSLLIGHQSLKTILFFVFYHVVSNQAVIVKAQREIDRVLQGSRLSVEHLARLEYLPEVVNETLRMYPAKNVLAFRRHPEVATGNAIYLQNTDDTQFALKSSDQVLVLLESVQKDNTTGHWGEFPDLFNPDRQYGDDKEDTLS